MTNELYEAVGIIHLKPAGAAIMCRCGQVHTWKFWPTTLCFDSDEAFVTGPRSLCGTRREPGLYAYQTLLWAYCPECKSFYGGVFDSRSS